MTKASRNLTSEERKRCISLLLENSFVEDGQRRLAHGSIAQIARSLNCSTRTVYRLWEKSKQHRIDHGHYFVPNKRANCGRHAIYNDDDLREALENIPMNERRTQRAVAELLGISLGKVSELIKSNDVIIPHSNALLTYLTEQNKFERAMFAASRFDDNGIAKGMYDEVYVDEKWFFITEKTYRLYLAKGEKAPKRRVKNKGKLIKVMFLTAVARPRFDNNGECTFDGKIGMWPFVREKVAQRNSVNRPAGTIELECYTVKKQQYLELMVEKVAPAIMEKWPDRPGVGEDRVHINIVHDNAPAHFKDWEEPDWVDASTSTEFVLHLVQQPPNSPDCNILDLGFFVSIQALQFSMNPASNIEELIERVMEAWDSYNPKKLNRVFLTHMQCMEQIILCDGDNTYAIPHMNKDKLEREGRLPKVLQLGEEAFDKYEELSNNT